MLVDGEGVEGRGVEGFAGEAHGGGEGGELAAESRPRWKTAMRKAAIWASVTSCLVRRAVDDGADEGLDFVVGEGVAVALVEDDVDGMDGLGHKILNVLL